MLTTSNIRNIYTKIQKELFYMIPEKWDRVYLYASVIERFSKLQTGEMFFYYYPKSVLRKNAVNVYEIPSKFNINEATYLKIVDKLYVELKELRQELIKSGEKPWSNVIISIENFKFSIEYNYENLIDSKYTSYDRHLIFRHKYLNISLDSYSKKEKKMIEKYLNEEKSNNKNINTYTEGIYIKQISNVIEYNKEEIEINELESTNVEDNIEEKIETRSQIIMSNIKPPTSNIY